MSDWQEDKPIQTPKEARDIFAWDEADVLL